MRAQTIKSAFVLMKGSLVPLRSYLAINKRKNNNKTALIKDELENARGIKQEEMKSKECKDKT
jgi:hypothetical protein